MKYAQKSFSVGGYSKAYADNWDKTFKRKPISLPDPDAYRCACGLHKVRGRLEWVDCAKHRSPSDEELLADAHNRALADDGCVEDDEP